MDGPLYLAPDTGSYSSWKSDSSEYLESIWSERRKQKLKKKLITMFSLRLILFMIEKLTYGGGSGRC